MGLSISNAEESLVLKCHPPGLASAKTYDASLVPGQHRPAVAALPLVSEGLGCVLLRGRFTG